MYYSNGNFEAFASLEKAAGAGPQVGLSDRLRPLPPPMAMIRAIFATARSCQDAYVSLAEEHAVFTDAACGDVSAGCAGGTDRVA